MGYVVKREFSNNDLVVVTTRSEGGKTCPCSGTVEDFKVEKGEGLYLVWLDVDQNDEPKWFPAGDVGRMQL